MAELWTHWPEYIPARLRVLDQSLADDLATIDTLFGRDELASATDPALVKQEALRQLEIEFRSKRVG